MTSMAKTRTETRRHSGGNDRSRGVLVAVDGSPRSQRAIREAVLLAHDLGRRLLGVHVITPWQSYSLRGAESPGKLAAAEMKRVSLREAKRHLAAVDRAAAAQRVSSRSSVVWHTSAADAIVDFARRERCSLIVVGTHGHTGLQRMLLGSVAQKVLAKSHVPVVVCR